MRHRIIAIAVLAGAAAFGDEVHVVEKTKLGDAQGDVLADIVRETGGDYATTNAPALGGWIFTEWFTTDATEGSLTVRDVFGRSFDAAPYHLYGETTLTANYVDSSLDTNNDGVPDGRGLYWYANTTQSATSDTDEDGFTFAEELAAGTNPLFPDSTVRGVASAASGAVLFNPDGFRRYVFRSEPEGEAFDTVAGYAAPGTALETPTLSRRDDFFACWTLDGVRQVDAVGRALDSVAFAMPERDVEYVAVLADRELERAALYWYGDASRSATSDTDGDGLTFAEEIAAGTNPLFADRSVRGVASAATAAITYVPKGFNSLTVMSDPEDLLVDTTVEYVQEGELVETPALSRRDDFFAYWSLNGVRQADATGRALDSLSFAMPAHDVMCVAVEVDGELERAALYWYGDKNVAVASDTDGDGLTFAEEIAAGTNPLFADRSVRGVASATSGVVEMNLQPYEQLRGAVVEGEYSEMFYSPIAGNREACETFGANLKPVVADVNGDGLFDLILVGGEGGIRVLVNVGAAGHPEFEEGDASLADGVDLVMNSVDKLDGMALDTFPVEAVSATVGDANADGIDDLLVSDSEGRIWYYEADGEQYTLQHKVWGGSFAGFAQGLQLAAVDWEADGDLDCLAGTADGKLMLLRDPKAGRPTNLKAKGGMDTILLTWDPNAQPRVRGYRVYRAEDATSVSLPDWPQIAEPVLPTYRDKPETVDDYAYRVTSLSRFYTPGNSTPTVSESIPSETARSSLGKVAFSCVDAAAFLGGEATVSLAIDNSLNLPGAGLVFVVEYDAEKLEFVRVESSGLTDGLEYSVDSGTSGRIVITATGGTVAAGEGTFLSFVFDATEGYEATTARVALVEASYWAALPVATAVELIPYDTPSESDEDAGELPATDEIEEGEVDDNNLDDDDGEGDETVKEDTELEIRGYGGQSGLAIGITRAKTGTTVTLPVGIRSFNFPHWWFGSGALNVDVSRTTINFAYDPVLLEPVRVESEKGEWAMIAKDGILTVSGKSGTLELGNLPTSRTQVPFRLVFNVLEQYSRREAVVRFGPMTIATTGRKRVFTPILRLGGVVVDYARPQTNDGTVVAPWSRGDVNGDGRLTHADLTEMARLMNFFGIFAAQNQLRAGDYNGNGRLDAGDWILMRQHFNRLGIRY